MLVLFPPFFPRDWCHQFLTRFITVRGWQMYVKLGPRSCIYTTFKPSWIFLKQYMRWTRSV